MMSYFIFGIILVMVVYYVRKLKKLHKQVVYETFLSKKREEKEIENYIKEKNRIIHMQRDILFYISDGIHNFGSMFFREGSENIEKEYFDNLRIFFSNSRWLSENLSKGLYSKEEYEEILKFIQEDFHDYFHNANKELNLKKFYTLIGKDTE